ncbi:MAG: hypothetical protein JW908_15570 [Anaerolineales bacterium]|nr:hypothetical protein [Anaerolineales bacterium]
MSPQNSSNDPLLNWLLEPSDPGVRYLALRDLMGLSFDDPELTKARQLAHREGPIAVVMDAMDKAGYWVTPGPGYNPKYRSTVWSLVLLAQLGARIENDARIQKACEVFLEHGLTPGGYVTASGAPSGTADCLQGNICWALLEMGYEDARLELAFEWMARSVTGEGVAPMQDKKAPRRYYAGKCGPNFACGYNDKLPCAWGAAKVMLAFGRLPAERRTPLIENAIRMGIDFFFSVDPATCNYPNGYAPKPSSNWWKFGFPVFYITDLLQIVEALAALGYRNDPRLENALTLIREKQDDQGRWLLEYDYSGKTWLEFGEKKQPNKWVTLRALRVLRE